MLAGVFYSFNLKSSLEEGGGLNQMKAFQSN